MKKLILTGLFSLLFLSSHAFADKKIICDTSADQLSQQFVTHWEHSGANWFSSWAHEMMGDQLTVGGMRGVSSTMPSDTNPHLSFLSAFIHNGRDEGEIEVDCQYTIHNPEICDTNCAAAGNNLLAMRTVVYTDANQCRYDSPNTVICN